MKRRPLARVLAVVCPESGGTVRIGPVLHVTRIFSPKRPLSSNILGLSSVFIGEGISGQRRVKGVERMGVWQRLTAWMKPREERNPLLEIYEAQMDEALERLRLAERLMREAGTLEDLDIGRTIFQSAQAEVSQLIRLAKKERGIALRPVAEVEERFDQLMHQMGMLSKDAPPVAAAWAPPPQAVTHRLIRTPESGIGAV
jgi:hypothetical protein